jgi:superfamily I DNA/RNA helicase
MEKFNTSKSLDIDSFFNNNLETIKGLVPSSIIKPLKQLMKAYYSVLMKGFIEIPHSFYLKRFQIELANNPKLVRPFDFIFLDEAGDLNEVTLDIVERLPSKIKFIVGDVSQNIFSFNHTINGFKVIQATRQFSISNTFRVSKEIAEKIETFCQTYIDKSFKFKGIDKPNREESSVAYITRTNAQLISQIIAFKDIDREFSLVRPVSTIFSYILDLLKLKDMEVTEQTKIFQKDIQLWRELDDTSKKEFKDNILLFIMENHKEDVELRNSIKLIHSLSSKIIYAAYNYAKMMEQSPTKHDLYLCTAHSSKGLQFGTVHIMDDLNRTTQKVLEKQEFGEELTNEDMSELYLYYVACSRAMHTLRNAKHIEDLQ